MTEQSRTGNIIECEGLVKIYKTRDLEVMALQGLDLEVEYGELMAIIGNSGSGKSTLLNMIGGLEKPSAGKLTVDGKNLFKFSDKDLLEYKRSTVGFVWQNNARNLVPYLTALENVQIPMDFSPMNTPPAEGGMQLSNDKKTRALQLLELVGMEHRKHSKLNQLSGGEQQRVAIAIALANNPRLLLADEPTGSVDVSTAARILEVMRELNRELKTTIMIVTHDRNLAKMVNRVVAIRDGKTAREFIVKQSYIERLNNLESFGKIEESTQEEYAVLDRAGRVQIPHELLEQMQLDGRKVKLELIDGKVVVSAPQEEEQ